MNRQFLSLCLLISSYTHSMEKSQESVGEIDILVLRVALEKKGFNTLSQEIESHQFKKSKTRYPYILFSTVHSQDRHNNDTNALLCQQVLFMNFQLNQGNQLVFQDTNKHNNKSHMPRIDYCTYVKAKKEKTIKIKSKFYDKEVLLQTVRNLNKNNQ